MTQHAPTRVAILDAFTTEAYKGNPAAVVLSTEPLGSDERRKLAIEFNQPAIAFVSHPEIASGVSFAAAAASPRPIIRWHTSSGDVLPLCGHATMAASSYLLDYFVPDLAEIRYRFFLPNKDARGDLGDAAAAAETEHELVATRCLDGRIEIALPAAFRGSPVPAEARASVLSALHAATGIGPESVEDLCASPSNERPRANITIRLAGDVDLGAVDVDSRAFLAIPYRGIYLTNRSPESSSSTHFRSRVFFPSVGILEDHVCGSAHTQLGPYWIEHESRSPATALPAVVEVDQVSPRGGRFALRWDGNWGEDGGLVRLRGRAKLMMEGHLRV